MGKEFIEYLDSKKLNIMCKHCNNVITDIEYLKTLSVETVLGQCTTFTETVNTYDSQNCSNGQFHKSDLVYIYDINSPFQCRYSGHCYILYCKICHVCLGWKHIDNNNIPTFLILKNKFN